MRKVEPDTTHPRFILQYQESAIVSMLMNQMPPENLPQWRDARLALAGSQDTAEENFRRFPD